MTHTINEVGNDATGDMAGARAGDIADEMVGDMAGGMAGKATGKAASEHARDRIVSVNQHGGESSSLGPKIIMAVLILAVAAVGSLMAFNNYRRTASTDQAQAERQRDDTAKPAARSNLRIFGPAQASRTAASTFTASSAPAVPPEGSACEDRLPSRIMTAADGKPLLTPTGQTIFICQNGQILLPPLPNNNALAPRPDSSFVPQQAASVVLPVNRYAGDILLSAPSSQLTAVALTPAAAAVANAPVSGDPSDISSDAGTVNTSAPAHPQGSLKAMLQSSPTSTVHASMIGDRDMILPEGREIDCNLSLRVISEVSGKAVCVLSSYVYGDSGKVVLAEPGSIATGEYVAFAAQGQRRLFVLWTRLKTTKGVIIALNSPAADALGTSGLDGYVDNRWSERVGAAFLLSMVQDGIGYETAKATSRNGNGASGIAVFQNTTEAGNRLAERILESTINIKPTIYKHQGDRATITVARDLDFGSVYVLRTQ